MKHSFAALGLLLAATGCASQERSALDGVYDPFESINRDVLAFNLAVDKAVLDPLADGYAAVTPEIAREGVGNFFRNLRSPVTVVNDVLQGDVAGAGTATARLAINSTVGLLGVIDAASALGLEAEPEDFGQTLAVYGVAPGPYLVLPFAGPTNLRDLAGRPVDAAANPLTYARFSGDEGDDFAIRAGIAVLSGINARAQIDDQIDQLRSQAEPYIALRRLHSAQRAAAIRDGEEEQDPYADLPDFDDY